MEKFWNVKALRISLSNYQKYNFCVTKITDCRNISAFLDQFACWYLSDNVFTAETPVISIQTLMTPFGLAEVWTRLQTHFWFMRPSVILHSCVAKSLEGTMLCCSKLSHCSTLLYGTTEFIHADHIGGGTEGTQQLCLFPEEVHGDRSMRMQVSDVCLLPSVLHWAQRRKFYVDAAKSLRRIPKWDLASIWYTLMAHIVSKPEASASLHILKCSHFATQYRNVHYFGRWL